MMYRLYPFCDFLLKVAEFFLDKYKTILKKYVYHVIDSIFHQVSNE